MNIVVTLLSGSGTNQGLRMMRLLKATKSLRILAVLKMARVARLPRFWSEFMDRSLSENSRVFLRLATMFCGILWLNHLLACLWYSIGTMAPSDTGSRWTLASLDVGGAELPYLDSPKAYQYMTAHNWSMAQTTLGAMEITSRNSLERAFNVLCLLLALLCGSTLISMLSATMVDLQMSHHERVRHLRLLRRYLRENGIGSILAIRTQRQANERLGERSRLGRQDGFALQVLSRSLQKQLHTEICESKLIGHPFFRVVCNVLSTGFDEFPSNVVTVEIVRASDDIFFAGVVAKAAYMISCGAVAYTQEPMTSPVHEQTTVSVDKGSWLCECALWTEWLHVGSARALGECELLVIDAESFLSSLQGHRIMGSLASEYGLAFHRRVMEATPPLGWWPTDLETPFAECADVVCLMPESALLSAENARSGGPLASLRGGGSLFRSPVHGLLDAVPSGGVVLVHKSTGEVEAVQHRIEYEILNDDGRLLVQVGTWNGTRAQSGLGLPTIKQAAHESTAECCARLVSCKLHPFAAGLSIERVERVVDKESGSGGVDVRRVTRRCLASFSGEPQAPMCTAHSLGSKAAARRTTAMLTLLRRPWTASPRAGPPPGSSRLGPAPSWPPRSRMWNRPRRRMRSSTSTGCRRPGVESLGATRPSRSRSKCQCE